MTSSARFDFPPPRGTAEAWLTRLAGLGRDSRRKGWLSGRPREPGELLGRVQRRHKFMHWFLGLGGKSQQQRSPRSPLTEIFHHSLRSGPIKQRLTTTTTMEPATGVFCQDMLVSRDGEPSFPPLIILPHRLQQRPIQTNLNNPRLLSTMASILAEVLRLATASYLTWRRDALQDEFFADFTMKGAFRESFSARVGESPGPCLFTFSAP
jgi:hypothetical protein